ncbi:MAG: hypothetical protein QGG40_06690, partial [Myxococcota bacterium]|nr:hypothetical protein [Myxococcota bacterium]
VVAGLRELVADGGLWWEGFTEAGDADWCLDPMASIVPLEASSLLYGVTVGALPLESRRCLDWLSVAEASLPLDVVGAGIGVDVVGAVEPLLKADLVSREYHQDGAWLGVRVPALARLVEHQMGSERASEIHRALADALAGQQPSKWRDDRRRWHETMGATGSDAPRALLELGEELLERGLPGMAMELLRRAMQSSEQPVSIATGLAVASADALEALGSRAEAARLFNEALHHARQAGLDKLEVRALLGLARAHQGMGNEVRGALLAEEALERLDDEEEHPLLPMAMFIAAMGHRRRARDDRARELFHRCIEISTRQGSGVHGAMAHGELAGILAKSGELRSACDHLDREGAALRGRGQDRRLVTTLFRSAVCRRRMGQVERALERLEEARQVASFADLPYGRALVDIGRASICLELGDLEQCTAWLRSGRLALSDRADFFTRLAFRQVQSQLRLAMGDLQAAGATLEVAARESQRAGALDLQAFCEGIVGALTGDVVRVRVARNSLERIGEQGLLARLLLYEARHGHNTDAVGLGLVAARASGDRFLLLEALFLSGSEAHRLEAAVVVREIEEYLPDEMVEVFSTLPALCWLKAEPGEAGGNVTVHPSA